VLQVQVVLEAQSAVLALQSQAVLDSQLAVTLEAHQAVESVYVSQEHVVIYDIA
jgi:hypothetical protein